MENIEKAFLLPDNLIIEYNFPKITSQPSFCKQVISPDPSSSIIDPYLCSLQRNYYYHLTHEMTAEEMEDDSNKETSNNHQHTIVEEENLQKN